MEIISYIQDKPRNRITFGNLNFGALETKFRKREKSAVKSVTYLPFTPELRNFSAHKVRRNFSVQNFLRLLGHSLTEAGEFISSNIKILSLSFVLFCLLVSGLVTSGIIHNRIVNFTGPLVLEDGHTQLIENLDKLMEGFALGNVEIDDKGNLLDVETFPAQSLTQPVSFQTYKVRPGDTISGIAGKFGLRNISTLISVNDIGNVRQLAAGQKLKIPSIDGIIYTVKSGDSLSSVVSKYGCKLDDLLDVNELTSETLTKGQQLFIPGAALDASTLKNAMGELFRLPISAKFRWSSPYGTRIDPIANVKSFHTGTDMACPTGTPILAAMSGRVTTTGINRVYGNYVIIDHGNGYQTLYAHMSKIIASKGQWVSQGTRIGLVGTTGYSTGPHLHFTVYKNGKLVDPMSVLK